MPAILLSLLSGGWGLLKGVGRWLAGRSLAEIGCIALALAALFLFAQGRDARHDRDAWKRQSEKCAAARKTDRETYTRAQSEAAKANKDQVATIKAKQESVTHEVESNLNARLEQLRRELRGGTPPVKGSPNGPSTGPDGKAPDGANGEAQVCIPASQFLLAAEYEEKLEQWVNWATGVLQIPR